MRNRSEVIELFEVSGAFDYVAKLVCPSLGAYQRLSEVWLDEPSLSVGRIVSNIVLRPIRDETVYPVSLVGTEPSGA